jgi:hypothetical protein
MNVNSWHCADILLVSVRPLFCRMFFEHILAMQEQLLMCDDASGQQTVRVTPASWSQNGHVAQISSVRFEIIQ